MIIVKNIHKSYGNIEAVKDISFEVKQGEIYAFLGENGAGKSTTINIICTILKKDKGDIHINGFELDRQDNEIKKALGVVFQNSYLDNKLSVYENLATRAALYGFSRKEIKERIEKVAERLELCGFIKQKYSTLSGGQRRRVDIARAILHQPKLLILDEPTTGLDPATRVRVWETIKRLQEQTGLTVFFSTHYMEEAEYANRISIIKHGKLAVTDTPYMLKQKFSYDTLNLYGNKPALIEYLKKTNHKFKLNNDHLSVKLKESMQSLSIVNDLKDQIQSFEVRKGNMDTVFLTVTGKENFEGVTNE